MNSRLLAGLALVCCVLTGCARIAVATAPDKRRADTRTTAALAADQQFWEALHAGHYDGITPALTALTAAYLASPGDDVTAAHIGWLHIWRIAESARLEAIPPTITDDMVLARKYFAEAVKLRPGEARYLGFLGSTMVAEGSIDADERLTRQGYYVLLDAVAAWPEFNLFTAGYTMSRRAADSPQYAQALKWQWENLNLCAGQDRDRRDPDFAAFMRLDTKAGPKRVCWNSWIAPHNFEGFFLNMGDMLVKAGDWQMAQRIYQNAKLSPDYARWPYASVLEERIRRAAENVAAFRADASADRMQQRIMIHSPFACSGCHQN